MKKKICITGASGFIGSNLTTYLSGKGYAVQALSLRNAEDLSIQDDVDAIVHLAGKAHDISGVADISEYITVNTELTIRLYDAFLQSKASVFIFMSSVKAVADKVDTVLNEQQTPDPQTAYGISKHRAEQYIQSKPASDKRVFILRPCMVHGPGNKGNLNLLYKIMKYGIPYPLASFNNVRSFLGVGNLCFIINEIITRTDIRSDIYNVADETPLSMSALIDLISEKSGKRLRKWKIKKSIIRRIAYMGDKLKLPLNSARLQKLTENYVVDPSKLMRVIGKPMPFTSVESIRITLQSFE